jgi:hypothetical protein
LYRVRLELDEKHSRYEALQYTSKSRFPGSVLRFEIRFVRFAGRRHNNIVSIMDHDKASSVPNEGDPLSSFASFASLAPADGSISHLLGGSTMNSNPASSVSSLLQQGSTSVQLQSILNQHQQAQQQQANYAIQQARYAMLLQAAGAVDQQGNNAPNPLSAVVALTQQLAQQASFPNNNPNTSASISSASAPGMTSNTPYQAAAQLLATQSAISVPAIAQAHLYGGHSLVKLG